MSSAPYHNPWRDPERPGRWLEFRHAADAPDRSEELGVLAAATLARVPEGGRVLELGCGDGALTERMLAMRADVSIAALDLRQEMLDAAAQRLVDAEGRLALFQHDLETDGWPAGAAGPFDAATTAMAMHLLPGEWQIGALRRVRAELKPGGALVLLDTFRDAEDAEKLRWDIHAASHPGLWRGGMTSNARTLDAWLAALRESGFADPRILWLRWPLVVLWAATDR